MDKWIARDGDMTYELSFRKDTIPYDLGKRREVLAGTLIYKRNGVVIRTISPPENPALQIVLYPDSSGRALSGHFGDLKENDAAGQLFFKLQDDNDNKATWTLIHHDLSFDGTNIGKFDLPTKMTFTRVQTFNPEPGAVRPGDRNSY